VHLSIDPPFALSGGTRTLLKIFASGFVRSSSQELRIAPDFISPRNKLPLFSIMDYPDVVKRAQPDAPLFESSSLPAVKKLKVTATTVAKGRKCDEPFCEKFAQVNKWDGWVLATEQFCIKVVQATMLEDVVF